MEESSMTREEAIAKAEKYSLQAEVIYCMDNLGYSPEEACDEWDL
jgi:hypothetical protein